MKGLLMFTSIDDVTPIDSNEVGNRVTDFLQSAGQVALITFAGAIVVSFILAIVIAKKAGYSGWWGFLAVLVPPFGFLLALLFAFLKWPALKQRDEAMGILKAHDLTLPSQERAAIKEAERRKQVEEEARRNMERAQADREKAEADRERFREAQARDAATRVASANAAALAAAPEDKPADEHPARPAAAEPEDKHDAEPEDKHDAEPEVKRDAEPEDKHDAEPEVKRDARPDTKEN